MTKNPCNNKRKYVIERITADTSRLYGPINDAIAYLREVLAKHPRAELTEHWTGYEDMELLFQWSRDETDEEMAARLAAEAAKEKLEAEQAKVAVERAKRKAQYEKLKKEFG